MGSLILSGVVVLIAALAWLFVLFARAIQQDCHTRFERVRRQLQRQANSVLGILLSEDRGNRTS